MKKTPKTTHRHNDLAINVVRNYGRKLLLLLPTVFTLLTLASTLNGKDLFIEETKKTAVFVFQDGPTGLEPVGTGFLAGVPTKLNPNRSHLYFVTAKHVLFDDTGTPRLNLVVRLNKKDSGSELLRLETTAGDKPLLFTHSSPLVDLAVVAVPGISDEKFDFKFVTEELLLTREAIKDLEISEGSDVFFTGLFLPFFGAGRNFPIVRTGKVALLTDEKIPWRTDPEKPAELRELFLLESQSFGGNSGSPVYVVAQKAALRTLRLIGVMMGTFEQGNPIAVVQNSAIAISKQNLGIAAVVPSYLLREILFGDQLTKLRTELEIPAAANAPPQPPAR